MLNMLNVDQSCFYEPCQLPWLTIVFGGATNNKSVKYILNILFYLFLFWILIPESILCLRLVVLRLSSVLMMSTFFKGSLNLVYAYTPMMMSNVIIHLKYSPLNIWENTFKTND